MDDQIMWLMELSCCWTSDPNVAMFPKESRLSPDEARYIVQQFDYVWGTYTGDTDFTHIMSDVESKRRAAVAASGIQLQTFRNRFTIIVDKSITQAPASLLSSSSGGGGADGCSAKDRCSDTFYGQGQF